MARTTQEIQAEYFQLCAQLGELEFHYQTIPSKQEKLRDRIKSLEEENKQAQRREAKKDEQDSTVAG